MKIFTRHNYLCFLMMLLFLFPNTGTSSTKGIEKEINSLFRNGRWEQAIVLLNSTIREEGPTDTRLMEWRSTALRERENLYLFLRIRNAFKRQDYATTLLLEGEVDEDSVYRNRTSKFATKARKRLSVEPLQKIKKDFKDDDHVMAIAFLDLYTELVPPNKQIHNFKKKLGLISEEKVYEDPNLDSKETKNSTLERDFQLPPDPTPEGCFDQGLTQLKLGLYEDAEETFSLVLQLEPQFAEAHLMRSKARRNLERYPDVIEDLKAFVELAPSDSRTPQIVQYIQTTRSALIPLPKSGDREMANKQYLKGKSAELQENINEALQFYQLALKTDPSFEAVILNLGVIFEKLERYPEALEMYQRYLRVATSDDNIEYVETSVLRVEERFLFETAVFNVQ